MCNWTGKGYIEIILDWYYNKWQVHPSMPIYMQKAFKQFQHKAGKLQHATYQSAPIQYGAKKQYTTQESKAPMLDSKVKRFIQQICDKYLFLGRAVDINLLCPISAIASQSSKPTKSQCDIPYNSLIIWPHRKMPYSPTMKAIWCKAT
jgi:hypothetical protein